eukprot:TRINITY_DN1862_c0_g1_i2.p1 TRINITY_DN1862_c0_g1~~TRINITY_DN1862_c0_g1_i2.p1  ORF type:complete len:428 (+),score=204.02 TRINITY_DN1862_c0_g1_i2:118-1284(+)
MQSLMAMLNPAMAAAGGRPQPTAQSASPPTRWEKAVAAVNGIVQQVAKIDPDGIDIMCFPGASDHVDIYRNIKDAGALSAMVGAREPGGPCYMGHALDCAFREAFTRGFAKPCSILVITAGRPDDYQQLIQNITQAAQNVQKDSDLTVTFVQVGDDQWATDYLKYLDDNLKATSASGEEIDIVDTVKDEDIKAAVGEVQQPGFMGSGGAGALLGAFSGMAMGVGGYYMYNKMQAKKRTEGWNGTWKVLRQGQEIGVELQVTDDMSGGLTIAGYPEDGSAGQPCSEGSYTQDEQSFQIYRHCGGTFLSGTVEDEHNISWQDGTAWEEVPPPGADWKIMAAAGAGGAAAGGAVGYLVQKKFFKKTANKDPSDYVIIIDRSQGMCAADTGK